MTMIEFHDGLRGYLTAVAKFQRDSKSDTATPAGFMLAHGREWKFDDKSFTGSGESQACFGNAGMRALDDDALTYVEGHVSIHGVPVDHAWLVDRAGRVVDPTLTSDLGRSVAGYFGVPIKTSYLRKKVLRDGRWGVLQYDNAKHYLRDSPKRIVSDKAWNEEDHPRHPAGLTEGGQFAPKGGGGAHHASEMARIRAAQEAAGVTESERVLREMNEAGENERLRHTIREQEEKQEEEQPYVPESWDDLSEDQQAQTRDRWRQGSYDAYLESEEEHWRETAAPEAAVEQIITQLIAAPSTSSSRFEDVMGWATDAFQEIRDKREEDGLLPIPFTDDQLILALVIRSTYEGAFTIDFDNAMLFAPIGFDPSPPFPGITPEKASDRLTKGMREELLLALTVGMELRRDDLAADISPPDLSDSTNSLMEDLWNEMEDSEKFRMARDYEIFGEEEESGAYTPPQRKQKQKSLPLGEHRATHEKLEAVFDIRDHAGPEMAKLWDTHMRVEPAEFLQAMAPNLRAHGRPILYINGDDEFGIGVEFGTGTAADPTRGSFSRTFNFRKGNVYHSYFSMPRGSQKAGRAKDILASQMKLYKQMGMKSVSLSANIDIGAYAWAKYGFLPTKTAWDRIRVPMQDLTFKDGESQEEIRKVKAALNDPDPRGMWTVADTPLLLQAGQRLGTALIGNSWAGLFNLDNPEQTARFDAYVASKKTA